MNRQSGFTIVEILVVVAIVGLLANFAVIAYKDYVWRARAAAVVTDYEFFRLAVLQYYRDTNEMPANGTAKKPPRELDPYLQGKLPWVSPRPGVRYDIWENWGGKKHGKRFDIEYGFSLKEPDPRLVAAIPKIYSGRFVSTVFKKYTFPPEGID